MEAVGDGTAPALACVAGDRWVQGGEGGRRGWFREGSVCMMGGCLADHVHLADACLLLHVRLALNFGVPAMTSA